MSWGRTLPWETDRDRIAVDDESLVHLHLFQQNFIFIASKYREYCSNTYIKRTSILINVQKATRGIDL
jgi:hypothetical protein